MKVLLLGLAAGGAMTLFADTAAPSPGDVLGGVGGAAGVGAFGIVFYMMREHRAELKETREEFVRRESNRDTMFNQTITTIVADFKTALQRLQDENQRQIREMREENQKNIERQFKHSEEVVAAMESVRSALTQLTNRMDDFEESKRNQPFQQTPFYPPPGQNPQNPPQPPPPAKPGGRR